MSINIGYVVILPLHDFHLIGQLMCHMYKYVLKHHIRQDLFKPRDSLIQENISKFLFLYCTYASLNTGGIKFIKLIIV